MEAIDPNADPLNPLQRWWLARQRSRYARLAPETARLVIARDRFLLSAKAMGGWAGIACGIVGTTFGLADSELGWGAALLTAVLVFAALTKAAMRAWVQPQVFTSRRLWRIALLTLLATYAGALATFRHSLGGLIDAGVPWYLAVLKTAWRATPLQLMVLIAALILLAAIATSRREYLQRALAQARAENERDNAARQLAQARLALLRAQIQPHFLFNTLAALQHWVDTGDVRAPSLLRDLTAFLRGSTELMLREEVTLAEEAEQARHYLEIMRARWGERLRYRIDVAADCADQPLPPGLLITLIENAVEHGIEPQLHGGEVAIEAHCNASGFVLAVRDDGPGPPADVVDGVGLTNSRERLRHRFGDAATLRLTRRDDGPGAVSELVVPQLLQGLPKASKAWARS